MLLPLARFARLPRLRVSLKDMPPRLLAGDDCSNGGRYANYVHGGIAFHSGRNGWLTYRRLSLANCYFGQPLGL